MDRGSLLHSSSQNYFLGTSFSCLLKQQNKTISQKKKKNSDISINGHCCRSNQVVLLVIGLLSYVLRKLENIPSPRVSQQPSSYLTFFLVCVCGGVVRGGG